MLEIAIGAAIGALIGALIPEVVKSLYRKRIGTRIKLSDEAKEVLRQMQSDPTSNGVFIESSPMSLAGVQLVCAYSGDIDGITTTWLVISELKSKSLVETETKDRGGLNDQMYVNLTHLGKSLNPDTGKAEKAR